MEKVKKIVDKKIFWLLYLYGITCCLSISASTIVLSFFLLYYLLDIKKNIKISPRDFIIFAIVYIWKIITLIFNGFFNHLDRIINIWDKTPYFTASVINVEKDKIIKFINIVLWLNTIIIIYALLQKYAGFPVLVKSLFTEDMSRFKGYFSHPLRFGGYISLVTLLSFSFALFYSNKFIKFVPFMLLSVFLNGSRSYIISIILTVSLVSYFKSKKAFFISLVTIMIFSLSAILFFPNVKVRILTTFSKTYYNQESSASLRLNYWKAGIEIFYKSPIYGIGDKEISNYLKPYEEKGFIDNIAHAHNSYITTAAENGIIGLGLFIWLFYFFIKKYFRIAFLSNDNFIKTYSFFLFSAFINLAVSGIFESNFSTFIIWSFLTFMMGIFEGYLIEYKKI